MKADDNWSQTLSHFLCPIPILCFLLWFCKTVGQVGKEWAQIWEWQKRLTERKKNLKLSQMRFVEESLSVTFFFFLFSLFSVYYFVLSVNRHGTIRTRSAPQSRINFKEQHYAEIIQNFSNRERLFSIFNTVWIFNHKSRFRVQVDICLVSRQGMLKPNIYPISKFFLVEEEFK